MSDRNGLIALSLPPLPYYVTTGLSVFAPGDQHPNRRNLGIFDLLWVVRGTLHIGEENRQWDVAAGQTLLLLPDRYHYAVKPCETETAFYWIHFDFAGEWTAEAAAEAAERPAPLRQMWTNPRTLLLPQYASPAEFAEARGLLAKLLAEAGRGRTAAYWQEQRLFLELLDLLEDRGAERDEDAPAVRLANKAEAYLRQHYQSDVTNRSLAEALHFHPNYVVRCMKETFGCSPMAYLHRYRLEQAKLLLLKTEWPVARIAERTGFSSAPYFSGRFRQFAGLSPLQFRKRYST
ncbi:helix-turn-helix transcriptional regulator [Paenibacillus sp. MWE-103]|uniref:Helix-turn-helix transcriptional regulator n=1 Tax=Paenibacillus artemisiicola TaxID=1172618 RepID=A0ABS3W9G6_9BACL|nr:AraC family transcriptional regulator [Paenibacillus artemisiicola]MBO7744806.1 helix-turn-helix transcriptional regulator [Paenibacillus artemisiicola]